MPDELTPFAVELITRCPQLINLFAERINRMINNWDGSDRTEVLEPVHTVINPAGDIQDLLSHVGYDAAQCGYDK